MNRRRLGTSDLEVSEIALGSWLTYAGGVERERAEACTQAAFEAGINFFDTANVYGQGAAERAWGEILGDYPREEYVLATKVYFPVAGGSGLSAEQIHKQIDASLARLQTDYVDLYQCHRFDVRHADRGDDGGARRCRQGGQGTLHRLQRVDARSRSRPASTPPSTASRSSPPSRSTRCSGGRRRTRSSRSARTAGSPRSSGRRWPRAC